MGRETQYGYSRLLVVLAGRSKYRAFSAVRVVYGTWLHCCPLVMFSLTDNYCLSPARISWKLIE